jgi:hypothetical protein
MRIRLPHREASGHAERKPRTAPARKVRRPASAALPWAWRSPVEARRGSGICPGRRERGAVCHADGGVGAVSSRGRHSGSMDLPRWPARFLLHGRPSPSSSDRTRRPLHVRNFCSCVAARQGAGRERWPSGTRTDREAGVQRTEPRPSQRRATTMEAARPGLLHPPDHPARAQPLGHRCRAPKRLLVVRRLVSEAGEPGWHHSQLVHCAALLLISRLVLRPGDHMT